MYGHVSIKGVICVRRSKCYGASTFEFWEIFVRPFTKNEGQRCTGKYDYGDFYLNIYVDDNLLSR